MNVFITGATGFLGGELLVDLSKRKEIDKIFCLVRAETNEKATQRIKNVFDFHGDFWIQIKLFPYWGICCKTI